MRAATSSIATAMAVPAAALAVAACAGGTGPDGGSPADSITVETVASGLAGPVHLTAPPGDDRLFIVEQPGRIRIVEDGTLLGTPFLDITDRVGAGGERGLLSMAFHPGYAQNGRFVVSYTDTAGDTRIEEYTVSADPNVADPAADRLILGVAQPYPNHNGGLVVFGPGGYLWIGLGDGGSGGDPLGNGQDSTTLLGSLLRIDIDGGEPYAIPPDNPFAVGGGGAPEIWAYGLRNPWRFSIDTAVARLYIADVGQLEWEEVHAAPLEAAGLNYGWNVLEGSHCYTSEMCDAAGLELPVHEYSHAEGCSITGGHVYRGQAIAGLEGRYFYGDYCGGWVASFLLDDGEATDNRRHELGDIGGVLSFGRDAAGELYVLTNQGTAFRIVPDR